MVGRENQGIRMSYILMIMHERVVSIIKVGQIDSNVCYCTLLCLPHVNRGRDIYGSLELQKSKEEISFQSV